MSKKIKSFLENKCSKMYMWFVDGAAAGKHCTRVSRAYNVCGPTKRRARRRNPLAARGRSASFTATAGLRVFNARPYNVMIHDTRVRARASLAPDGRASRVDEQPLPRTLHGVTLRYSCGSGVAHVRAHNV